VSATGKRSASRLKLVLLAMLALVMIALIASFVMNRARNDAALRHAMALCEQRGPIRVLDERAWNALVEAESGHRDAQPSNELSFGPLSSRASDTYPNVKIQSATGYLRGREVVQLNDIVYFSEDLISLGGNFAVGARDYSCLEHSPKERKVIRGY